MSDSQASHRDLSCADVLQRLYDFLDGELTERVEQDIREHLAICRTCYPQFRHEEVFLKFLARRTQFEKAPPALRRRIMKMLVDEEASRCPD